MSKIMIVGATPEQVDLLNKRAEFVRAYCQSKGWPLEPATLTMTQILEIRAQEGWKSPK